MPAIRESCSSSDSHSRSASGQRPSPTSSMSRLPRTSPKPSCPNVASSLEGSRSKTVGQKKKKKPANAFILFRSYVLQHYPPAPKTHQNDVSIEVARLWREATPEFRSRFFIQAELEKARHENECLPQGSGATITFSMQETSQPNKPCFDQRLSQPHPSIGRSSNLDLSAPLVYPAPLPSTTMWIPQVSFQPSKAVSNTAGKPDFSATNAPHMYLPPTFNDALDFDWSADVVASDLSLHPDMFR